MGAAHDVASKCSTCQLNSCIVSSSDPDPQTKISGKRKKWALKHKQHCGKAKQSCQPTMHNSLRVLMIKSFFVDQENKEESQHTAYDGMLYKKDSCYMCSTKKEVVYQLKPC